MEIKALNSNLVLDSSVVIKWFCQEKDTNLALTLRELFAEGKINLSFPDLIIYEVANALRYNKNLTEKDVEEAVNTIIDLGADIIVPTKNIIKTAISFAYKYDITIYDSYYPALAKAIGFTLITADGELHNKTKDLSIVKLLNELVFEDRNGNN